MTSTIIQIQDLQQDHQITELSSAEKMMIYGGCHFVIGGGDKIPYEYFNDLF